MAALFTMLGWATPPDVSSAEPEVISNSIGMKLVESPAGEFMMGAEEDRADTLNRFPYLNHPEWLDGELPRHKVRITKSFFMGQHEVTLGQFLKFYHTANYKVEIERDGEETFGIDKDGKDVLSNLFRPWDPRGWKIEMDHPVIYVSWNDCVAFCEWLSKKEGKTYRLPTEAEWEYACRAGTNSRYHFGDDQEELIRFANVMDADLLKARYPDSTKEWASRFVSRRDGYVWTAPVGKFRPNAFDLYDMHGNVSEWCSDWSDKHYYEQSPMDDPQGPSTGSFRALRGGGYGSSTVLLRCAYRGGGPQSYRTSHYGFRVVCAR